MEVRESMAEVLQTAPASGRGVQLQMSRQRWEAAWITQQRESLTTVTYEQRSASAGSEENQSARRREAGSPSSTQQAATLRAPEPQQPAHQFETPMNYAPANAELHRSVLAKQVSVYAGLHAQPISNAASRRDVQPAGGAAASSDSTPAQWNLAMKSRSDYPHFALWRNDDAVRLSIRLREPERAMTEVVPTLQAWLKQAGLTIVQVVVNGHVLRERPGMASESTHI